MAPDAPPTGAAQDGGSLTETVTVPKAGLCMDAGPPPQLMTMKATAMTKDARRTDTGCRFNETRAWASMGSLRDFSDEVVICRQPGVGQNAGARRPLRSQEKPRVIST